MKEERKIWAVRRERNKVIFENEDSSLSRLKSSFDYLLHSWASLCVNSESRFVCNQVNLTRCSCLGLVHLFFFFWCFWSLYFFCTGHETPFVYFLYTPWIAFWLPFFCSSMTFHFYL